MEISSWIILIVVLMLACSVAYAHNDSKRIVHVFHKNKAPSLKALKHVNEVLILFAKDYEVLYHDIEDASNLALIESFGLPETHFPIAVVIDGKFTMRKDGRIASFVHFPVFMKGIGRHEGNWSGSDLEAALRDPSVLLETNILPELDAEESEGECR